MMSAKKHVFTLGIEEEFAIIDPATRELRSHIHEILEGGKIMLKEQIKPEMHQSVVELGTEICQSIVDARAHVLELRSKLAELAGRSGARSPTARRARAGGEAGLVDELQGGVARQQLAAVEADPAAAGEAGAVEVVEARVEHGPARG